MLAFGRAAPRQQRPRPTPPPSAARPSASSPSRDDRLPARIDRRRARGGGEARRRRTASRSTAARTRASSTTRTSPATRPSCSCSRPATSSTTTSRRAFERFIRAGGGFVGVHSAADTEYDWPWYGGLVGAYFDEPPGDPAGDDRRDRRADPSTAGLPTPLDANRRVVQLPHQPARDRRATCSRRIDETTYDPGPDAMGSRPPDRLVARLRRRPRLVHGRAATPSRRTPSRCSSRTCSAGSSGRPGRFRRPSPRRSPGAPKITSVKTALSGKRVVVTVKHSACACDVQLAVTRSRTGADDEDDPSPEPRPG